jgi:hypothetical protein
MRNGTALSFATALLHVPCPSGKGRGGRRGMSITSQVLPNKKAQNKCDGGRAQGGKYVKWYLKKKKMRMMTHL